MTVFISYSHADKDFVDKLATHLIKSNIHIWLDRWELKVGDSITSKIQEALSDSDYLLLVLSKKSVESDWLKRELNAALLREIEEKRAVILPVLIEDCEIPLFVRDKLYADFREQFNSGLRTLLDALSAKHSPNQFRIDTKDYETDWGLEWHVNNEEKKFIVEADAISYNKIKEYSILLNIYLIGNERILNRFKLFDKEELGWFYKNIVLFMSYEAIKQQGSKILLEDSFAKYIKGTFFDVNSPAEIDFIIRSKWLGNDIGNNLLFDYVNTIEGMLNNLKEIESDFVKKNQTKISQLFSIPI